MTFPSFQGPLLQAYAQDGQRQGRGSPGASWCRSDRVLTCGNGTRKLIIPVVICPVERADEEDYAKHLSLKRLTCDDACDKPGFA